jgi:acyl dehydratase
MLKDRRKQMSLETALEELKPQIGTETFVGEWFEITQDRINQFADATLDHQWIHVDVEKANTMSPFGSTVAHGFLTLALTPYLSDTVSPDKPPFPDMKMAVNYGMNRVRFPNAVKPGDRIRVRSTLQNAEEVKGSMQVISLVTVEIEGEEKPGCVAEMVARFYF